MVGQSVHTQTIMIVIGRASASENVTPDYQIHSSKSLCDVLQYSACLRY
jgi:hypothetical protein